MTARGPAASFRALIRKIIGLSEDPGTPPDLILLGRYRCSVEVVHADRTLDLRPEDSRIAPRQNVQLRQPFPGSEVTVAPGAVVLMGWERGDRSRPYAVPEWEDGATLQKLVMNAVVMYLGGADGVDPPQNGVVLAGGIDPFTGSTYGALNNASLVVMAKKA